MKFFMVFSALASAIIFVSAEAPLPSSQYGTPAPAISVQYGAPQPAPQYGAPAPAPQYGAPAPAPQYGAPAPAPQYGAPAPAPQYGAPAPAPQYGAPPSTEYGAPAGGKVRKYVSVHVGGNDDVSDQVQTIRAGGPPDTNYNIIFVKAPSASSNQQTEVILPEQNRQKTVVYVLVKKPDSSSNIRVRGPAPTSPSKPDVYFIRYKNEQPSGAYGAPAPQYGAPAPAPQYGAPAPAPSSSYGTPS